MQEDKTFTKSQKMRHVIYRIWENRQTDKTKEEYYNKIMDELIEKLKQKIDPLPKENK